MRLSAIETGTLKLDGGAMFGVVPKVIWNTMYPSDENNLCTWALRCLLVEEGDRKILIDCGIGNKQDEKFLRNYHLENTVHIVDALRVKGIDAESITDVVLTHLHFDHCGGAVSRSNGDSNYGLTFKNADYWISRRQWEWAVNPNRRESASYLKENFIPIQESEKMKLVEMDTDIFPFFRVKLFFGHTAGQMIPHIRYRDKTIVFMGDLIPSAAHIPLPYIMSFDTSPLISLKEKEAFLNEAAEKKYILFFEHDRKVECCSVYKAEKGVRIEKTYTSGEIFG